jgi:hypothetical protein
MTRLSRSVMGHSTAFTAPAGAAGVLFVAAAAAERLAREPSGLSADWGQPPPLNAGMMVGMIWRLLRR